MTKKFAPFHTRPNMSPKIFDPNQQTFVPDRSLDDSKIREVSVRRVQMLGAKVYNSATQNFADNGDYHNLVWDTKTFDEGNLWQAGDPNKLTIPYDGIWTVSCFISYAGDGTGNRRLQLTLNGNSLLRSVRENLGVSLQVDLFVTSDFKLTKGDVLRGQGQQDSGGALNIAAGEDDNFFSAVFRGPV